MRCTIAEPTTLRKRQVSPDFMRNAVLGLICAAALALALSDIAIFGIAMWKIELAIVGALLFVTAGKKT